LAGSAVKGIRDLVTGPPREHIFAKIESPYPPYAIRYRITVRGKLAKAAIRPEILARGHYHNWTWVVKADPRVGVAIQDWQHAMQRAAPSGRIDAISPTLAWDAMMRRIYDLDAYLLGSTPIPADIHVLILQKHEAYHFRTTLRSHRALPLRIVYYDSPALPSASDFRRTQSSVVFIVQYLLQGLLADAEWKAGFVPRPPKGSNRFGKHFADELCWTNAAIVATIAGSPLRWGRYIKGFSPSPLTGLVGAIVKVIARYSPHPHSFRSAEKPAMVWEGISMQEYLRHHALGGTYPNRGTDIRWIDASINFCRSYTHYRGNIENHPVPPDTIQGGEFFPISTSAREPGQGESRH
jgi:hypothetical protein